MLIILEGVDGAGKSTLARELAAALTAAYLGDRVDVWAKRPPSRHPLAEYETPLFHYRPGANHHVICDRWHLGEAVYPAVLGRSTSWDVAVSRHVEAFLRSRGALLVHVSPPLDVIRRRFTARGDDLVRVEQLNALHASYLRQLRTPLTTYTAGGNVTPFIVEQIITLARTLDGAHTPLNTFVTYVGPRWPRYLLLGDVRHELRRTIKMMRHVGNAPDPLTTINNGPAFGPYPGTSGHYLLSHLSERFWQSGVGLANACDVDDVTALRETLGNPGTVALGVNAWRVLRALPGQHGAAPHPQYWRRFLHKHGTTYGELIYQAVTYGKNELGWRPE